MGESPPAIFQSSDITRLPSERPPTTTREIKKGGSMPESISRRKLLRQGSQAVAGGLCIGCALPANASTPAASAVDYHQRLGVTPFINAAGTYTILSASTMPDEVQAAVALAAKRPVHLLELHQAAGEYLAKRLRCEGALVTPVLPLQSSWRQQRALLGATNLRL